MQNRNTASPDKQPIGKETPVTPECFRSATEAIRRVLEGSTSLEDWDSAFSQVFALHDRATNSETGEATALASARDEYHTMLRQWHEQLPRLREWLMAEKKRIESRQAHGTNVISWLKTHGQTR